MLPLDGIRNYKSDIVVIATLASVILRKWKIVGLLGFGYAVMSVPLEETFESAFDRWFDTQYFPLIARNVHALWSSERNTWGKKISDQVLGMVSSLNPPTAISSREKIKEGSAPTFLDCLICRVATQRLGCTDNAQKCVFFGFLNRWLPAPWFVPLESNEEEILRAFKS